MVHPASPAEMTAWSLAARARGERIAFVPTMGALHEGHVTLLREARRLGDTAGAVDLRQPDAVRPERGSRPLPARPAGRSGEGGRAPGPTSPSCPTPRDVYPAGFQTTVEVPELARGLCGPFRPGHFAGVATVVCKLFNVVRPDVAVFGEKDYQQLAIVRRMVTDLEMGIEIVGDSDRARAGWARDVVAQRLPDAGAARASPVAVAGAVRGARRGGGRRRGTGRGWSPTRARRWTSIGSTTSSSSTRRRCRR